MVEDIFKNATERMEKAVNVMLEEFLNIRTGRANPTILDKVKVPYYGVETPIRQLCSISIPEARQILVKPYDISIIDDVLKAIIDANLGFTPTNIGEVIRINIPPLTEERRLEFVKDVKRLAEEGKIAIRNIRRDANDQIKKLSLTEDEEKTAMKKIQDLTDKYNKIIDEETLKKENEIMTV